jgi:hypothetical protein
LLHPLQTVGSNRSSRTLVLGIVTVSCPEAYLFSEGNGG